MATRSTRVLATPSAGAEHGGLRTLWTVQTAAPPGFTTARLRTRVRYAECDGAGIAHHSAYVPWFENGRIDLLRHLGYPYEEVEAQGLAFPLTECHVRYDRPLRAGDPLEVEACFLAVDTFRLTFGCKIFSSPDQRKARAWSVHALVDRTMKVRPIPDDLREMIAARLAPAGYLGRRFGP